MSGDPVDGEQTEPITVRVDGTDVLAPELPWWRRPRRLRRQLIGGLVFVALLSVVLVGALNVVAARNLLENGTREQLASIGAARARSIEAGIERTESQASAAAADLAVVEALEELSTAFDTRGTGRLDDAQLAELDDYYQQTIVDPVTDAGLGPITVEELRPASSAGQYLQYHYTVPSGDDAEARMAVADAGDGSDYSEVHARHHEQLSALAETLGVGDLLLVSAGGDIVYSSDKRVDFGTDLVDGPYRDTELAETVLERLPFARIGQGILADLEIYLPAGGEPVFYVTAGVRRDQEVIGALVLEIPVEALSAITTANESWEEVGLQEGESYVVGSDGLLRSESRPWIEDPVGYLDRVDDEEVADLIRTFESPVGIQPVDTEPVDEALSGRVFEGTARNYLGQRTYSFATPIDAPGVDWVVVADVPLSDARSPLFDYARRLGVVLLVVLPLAGLIGYYMAGRLTRPIRPVVEAARAVAAGDRDPDLPNLGRDEFGDLGRRLQHMARRLGEREAEVAAEYEDRRQLLLTVLPPQMVRDDGQVIGSGDLTDVATVVAVGVGQSGARGEAASGEELDELLVRELETAQALASDRGLDRIRAGADSYLFLAGANSDDDGADQALEFATALAQDVRDLEEGVDAGLLVKIALSTGTVAAGMLERGSLTFAAWGEPVRRALVIGALSLSDEILVDASTVAAASPDRWDLDTAVDVVDLDGQRMDLFALGGSRGATP